MQLNNCSEVDGLLDAAILTGFQMVCSTVVGMLTLTTTIRLPLGLDLGLLIASWRRDDHDWTAIGDGLCY